MKYYFVKGEVTVNNYCGAFNGVAASDTSCTDKNFAKELVMKNFSFISDELVKAGIPMKDIDVSLFCLTPLSGTKATKYFVSGVTQGYSYDTIVMPGVTPSNKHFYYKLKKTVESALCSPVAPFRSIQVHVVTVLGN